jgi:pimeloyl-ACP methyl ester carboxylesterase
MQAKRQLVPMPDGRDIDVLTTGPEDGFPLVVHGGTPSGLVVNSVVAEAAAERGLRYVETARPGYEGSTARPGRRVADVAADVAVVLDALGAGPFVSIGMSGGGPHSLACAALLPGRCLAAASIAGVGPYGVEGLDFMAGMGPENVTEFGLALQGAEALTRYLEKESEPLRQITGDQIVAELGGLVSGADKDVITGEFADELAAGCRAAVREGIAGWRDDDLAFARDWGFSLGALAGRAAVWQGDQDLMVPFAHGQWLAAHIPAASVHLEPGAGHLTMTVTAIDRILDDLLDLAGLSRPRHR